MSRIYLTGSKDEVGEDILTEITNTISYHTKSIPKPNYKPSSIDCIRKMFFIKKSLEPAESFIDANLIGIQESGTDRHKRIQDYIKKSKNIEFISVVDYVKENNLDYLTINSFNEYETHLYDSRYDLSFMADGLIRFKDKIYILEIKTMSNSKFYSCIGVFEKHVEQAACYSISFGIDNIIFIYENRDCLNKKVYRYRMTVLDKKGILNKINNCNKFLARDVIPPKPVEAGGSFCQYCNYRGYCK